MTLTWTVRPTAVTLTLAAALVVSCAAAPPVPAAAAQPRDACQQAVHAALQRDVARVRAVAAELQKASARFSAGTPDDATRDTLAREAFDALQVALPYASNDALFELRDLAHAVARLDGEVLPVNSTALAAALRKAAAGLPHVAEVLAREAEVPTWWSYLCETARTSVDAGTAATPASATPETESRAAAGRLHAAAVDEGERCFQDIRRHLAPSGDDRAAAMQLAHQCKQTLYPAYQRCRTDVLPAARAFEARSQSFRGLLSGLGHLHETDGALSRREGAYLLERARETLDGLAAPLSELREAAWARVAAEQIASTTMPSARFGAIHQFKIALDGLRDPCSAMIMRMIEIECAPAPDLCQREPIGS